MRRRRNTYIFAPERETHHVRTFFVWVAAVLVLGIAITFTLNFVKNHQVTFETEKVTVQNLPADLENWTILHISDLHGQELGDKQNEIRQAIALKTYSSVVFTGDMVGASGNVQPFLDLLALLPVDVPKFLIAGDSDPTLVDVTAHGSLSVYSDWVRLAQDAGVTVLDEPVMLTRNKSNIWFIPEDLYSLDLDSMQTAYETQLAGLNAQTALTPDQAAQKRAAEYHLGRIERLRETKKTISDKDIQIVLTHTPLTADYVSTMLSWVGKEEVFSLRHAALVLAGHYTAGQWRLPWGGAIYVPDFGWFPADQYITGLNYLSGIPQYISPGLAASDCYPWQPGRFFNPPTVTMITLTSRIV